MARFTPIIPAIPCAQTMRLLIISFIMYHPGLLVADAEAAGHDSAGSLAVSIEDIRYTGNDEYLIALAVVNSSSKEFLINNIDYSFELQKENGWHALRTSPPSGKSLILPLLLAAGTRSDFVVRVDVPAALPGLFKTYEGDISLMLTYRIHYIDHPTGRKVVISGESLYWISPRTSKWIHREGM